MADHPNLSSYLSDYANFHQTKGNCRTHIIGIPLIVVAVSGLLNKISFYDTGSLVQGSLGLIAYGMIAAFYVAMSLSLGSLTALFMAGLYLCGSMLPVPVLVALFLGGWAIQFFGHIVYEKKSPAFMKNAIHLLIGPMFIVKYFLKIFYKGEN